MFQNGDRLGVTRRLNTVHLVARCLVGVARQRTPVPVAEVQLADEVLVPNGHAGQLDVRA